MSTTTNADNKIVIVVCGSRTQNDYDEFSFWLKEYLAAFEGKEYVVVTGAAYYGADAMAALFCEKEGIELREYPANWDTHGPRSGYIRNQEMREIAKSAQEAHLIAFWDGTSTGTAEMFDKCMEQKIHTTVVVFSPNPNLEKFGYLSEQRRRAK